jgi:uncharacterized protein
MTPRTCILIFIRYPVPGQAKTRLTPALGAEGAARLHRRMAEHVVAEARNVQAAEKNGVTVTICYTGGRRRDFHAWLGTDLAFTPQVAGDLGDRMHAAFAQAFDEGAERVLAIGVDIPALSRRILCRAFNELSGSDVVIGPAMDGGYYLIGMKKLHAESFSDIDWGTSRVLAQTRDALSGLRISVDALPALADIDRPEDLPLLSGDARFADLFMDIPSISIIIPTLNEERFVERTLQSVHGADNVEIIVVDGGSRDATRAISTRAGAKVMTVPGGRAVQMNAAAAVSRGRILLFLHADTLLPANYAQSIRAALDEPATVAGAFRFQTDGAGIATRLLELATDIRSRHFGWPYGDQGLFLEKRVFDEEGGFAGLPIMEDFEMVRRLRRRGRIVTLRDPIVTSSRRWERLGIIRTTTINQVVVAGFLLGIPPEMLRRLYRIR